MIGILCYRLSAERRWLGLKSRFIDTGFMIRILFLLSENLLHKKCRKLYQGFLSILRKSPILLLLKIQNTLNGLFASMVTINLDLLKRQVSRLVLIDCPK